MVRSPVAMTIEKSALSPRSKVTLMSQYQPGVRRVGVFNCRGGRVLPTSFKDPNYISDSIIIHVVPRRGPHYPLHVWPVRKAMLSAPITSPATQVTVY